TPKYLFASITVPKVGNSEIISNMRHSVSPRKSDGVSPRLVESVGPSENTRMSLANASISGIASSYEFDCYVGLIATGVPPADLRLFDVVGKQLRYPHIAIPVVDSEGVSVFGIQERSEFIRFRFRN